MVTGNGVPLKCYHQAFRLITLLMVCLGSHIGSRAQNIDIDILKKINNDDISSGTYKSLRFISANAAMIGLSVPIGLMAAGIIEDNRSMKLKAVFILESMLLNEGITYAFKYSVQRRRPFDTYPFIIRKSSGEASSFPSGHTSFSFAMATSLSLAYPKWYIITPSILYASTIGYSRMYLGVHYPSDVLAGAIIGAGSSFLTYKANKWLHRSKYKSLSVSW